MSLPNLSRLRTLAIETRHGREEEEEEEEANPSDKPSGKRARVGGTQPLVLPDRYVTASEEGGHWLWRRMRALEKAKLPLFHDVSSTMPPLQPLAATIGNEDFRTRQMQLLSETCADFMKSLDETDQEVAFSYVGDSNRFNRFLMWPSAKVDDGNPSKIPTESNDSSVPFGPGEDVRLGPAKDVHVLYKLFNSCPRLDRDAVYLRGVHFEQELPHKRDDEMSGEPLDGSAYLNVTFMSTTTAAPEAFLGGGLSTHYNQNNKCCIFAVRVPAGFPALPLYLGNWDDFDNEFEILLPPGIVLVYLGKETLALGSDQVPVHSYLAELPEYQVDV